MERSAPAGGGEIGLWADTGEKGGVPVRMLLNDGRAAPQHLGHLGHLGRHPWESTTRLRWGGGLRSVGLTFLALVRPD